MMVMKINSFYKLKIHMYVYAIVLLNDGKVLESNSK